MSRLHLAVPWRMLALRHRLPRLLLARGRGAEVRGEPGSDGGVESVEGHARYRCRLCPNLSAVLRTRQFLGAFGLRSVATASSATSPATPSAIRSSHTRKSTTLAIIRLVDSLGLFPIRLGASASLDYVPVMVRDPDTELRAFVDAWRIASARLEDLRRRDLRNVNVADHIEALNGAFEAMLARPPRTSSGLVEQQAIFARMRHAGSVPAGG